MSRRKTARKTYVLYGCPIDSSLRYEVTGYVGRLPDGKLGLVGPRSSALVYTGGKKPGHGTPTDWAEFFKEEYGFNVHPIFLDSL